MKCPYCSQQTTGVIDSRNTGDASAIRRRRSCDSCDKRFTTYERIEDIELKVVKKDGEAQDFSRDKLRRGIIKATWKRPVSMSDIDTIVEEVECTLRRKDATRVKSWEIGNLVIERLRSIDKLSYLLFASVYRDFDSIDDFANEIEALRTEGKTACSLQNDAPDGSPHATDTALHDTPTTTPNTTTA